MSTDRSASDEVGDLQQQRDLASIGKIARGDEHAFGDLFRRYAPGALGIATRVLVDRVLAEEVVQEVFVSLWKRAGQYDGSRGTVRSWLLAQAHHRAVDVVRREEAERRRTTTTYAPEPPLPSADDVIEDAWLADRRARVQAALPALPDEQRAVLEKTYFEGLTQAQAAEALGVPLGTVKSRTVAAMRRLRDTLERRSHGGGEQS
ncbi:MAG TPA: sigma-70 family RNA polymerase sigma factor [Actinomycetota bacterium]|nr:sigma-70 family RNA polymerase sigma factor [Actinomycetota bacterium]